MSFSNYYFSIFILLSISVAQAEIIKLKVFESSLNKFQPFEVVIETQTGEEDIKRVTIGDAVKNITFFDLKDSELVIKTSKSHVLVREKAENLFPINKAIYNNYWGDAPIDPNHTYSIEINLNLKNRKIIGGTIEIGDYQHEEMALWGDLIP